MTPTLVLAVIGSYFLLLFVISYFTSRGATSSTFFTGNRESPWYLVAFGMIGASLSGVTFISVPGEVGNSGFTYFQVVLGYLPGYLIIATVLMPLYYKLNLVTIYTYLEQRFGVASYKTGSFFFLLSRVVGSSFRLFLVAGVLQLAIFDSFGIPFWACVLITIGLIWLYTFKGGIKTVVWTDTLQTGFMILAVVISIYLISTELNIGIADIGSTVVKSEYFRVFEWDWQSGRNFFKQFFAGAFIAIVMTGLDQDMMQKNLTCRNIGDAQKNMFWFCVVLVIVNFLFLSLGALLFMYAEATGIPIPDRTDNLYPMLALGHFNTFAGVLFLLGIVAAAYSSADSALTAMTTSFCVDFLGFEKKEVKNNDKVRMLVHLGFSFLLFFVILIFNAINDSSVINSVFTAAGYTYGPLLGLFSFGLFTKRPLTDKYVPVVCVLSPLLSYLINISSESLLWGYKFGFEILLLNGLLTFLGLWAISSKRKIDVSV
ncbi:sodium:solute symporter [uncultured Imperialibacter sp.]|uniref:sodium:solute symporter n=1 Tax=uncultured Imperialibacter sp. TaxID=1672639 RepID=UPI0030DBCFF3|tara:strand:+ start:56746 stop:58203 length:1458 start_codon:yes stop_codon:yes gene_type:complete